MPVSPVNDEEPCRPVRRIVDSGLGHQVQVKRTNRHACRPARRTVDSGLGHHSNTSTFIGVYQVAETDAVNSVVACFLTSATVILAH
mgnify:CR=1 FL=1